MKMVILLMAILIPLDIVVFFN